MARIAYVVGVSEYRNGLTNLSGPSFDVAAIQILLEKNGYKVHVRENPDLYTFKKELSDCATKFVASLEDSFLFYYSGHGLADYGILQGGLDEYYLTASDTIASNSDFEIYSVMPYRGFVVPVLEKSKAGNKIVILDSCYSGSTAKDASSDVPVITIPRTAVLTACNGFQKAHTNKEKGRLSVYTEILVEGIESGRADLDGDGCITAEELHDYIAERMKIVRPSQEPKCKWVESGHRILVAHSKKTLEVQYLNLVSDALTEVAVSESQVKLENIRITFVDGLEHNTKLEIEAGAIQQRQEVEKEYRKLLRKSLEQSLPPFTQAQRSTHKARAKALEIPPHVSKVLEKQEILSFSRDQEEKFSAHLNEKCRIELAAFVRASAKTSHKSFKITAARATDIINEVTRNFESQELEYKQLLIDFKKSEGVEISEKSKVHLRALARNLGFAPAKCESIERNANEEITRILEHQFRGEVLAYLKRNGTESIEFRIDELKYKFGIDHSNEVSAVLVKKMIGVEEQFVSLLAQYLEETQPFNDEQYENQVQLLKARFDLSNEHAQSLSKKLLSTAFDKIQETFAQEIQQYLEKNDLTIPPAELTRLRIRFGVSPEKSRKVVEDAIEVIEQKEMNFRSDVENFFRSGQSQNKYEQISQFIEVHKISDSRYARIVEHCCDVLSKEMLSTLQSECKDALSQVTPAKASALVYGRRKQYHLLSDETFKQTFDKEFQEYKIAEEKLKSVFLALVSTDGIQFSKGSIEVWKANGNAFLLGEIRLEELREEFCNSCSTDLEDMFIAAVNAELDAHLLAIVEPNLVHLAARYNVTHHRAKELAGSIFQKRADIEAGYCELFSALVLDGGTRMSESQRSALRAFMYQYALNERHTSSLEQTMLQRLRSKLDEKYLSELETLHATKTLEEARNFYSIIRSKWSINPQVARSIELKHNEFWQSRQTTYENTFCAMTLKFGPKLPKSERNALNLLAKSLTLTAEKVRAIESRLWNDKLAQQLSKRTHDARQKSVSAPRDDQSDAPTDLTLAESIRRKLKEAESQQPIPLGKSVKCRKIAFIVGVSEYRFRKMSYPSPIRDAHAVSDALKSIGFETFLLLDPNLADLESAIDKLAEKEIMENDLFLFYFSGSAWLTPRRTYALMASDSQESDPRTMLPFSEGFVPMLFGCRSSNLVVVLDTSFGGCAINDFEDLYQCSEIGNKSFALFVASKSTELVYSYPDKLSDFTELFVKAIKNASRTIDEYGVFTASEMARFIQVNSGKLRSTPQFQFVNLPVVLYRKED